MLTTILFIGVNEVGAVYVRTAVSIAKYFSSGLMRRGTMRGLTAAKVAIRFWRLSGGNVFPRAMRVITNAKTLSNNTNQDFQREWGSNLP
jgi:hypothetical protein